MTVRLPFNRIPYEFSEDDTSPKKPRGTPRERRPRLKGSPAADAVIEDRR